jgi:hypothetical protein
VYVALPLPVPAPDTVIQLAALEADHVQPAWVVTPSAPLALEGPAVSDAGDNVNVHGTPACVTVNVEPAMKMVPVRLEVTVLAATLYGAAPLPFAETVPVIVIQ